jgi:hypothetical protein
VNIGKRRRNKMDKLKEAILKEYANIRIEKGDNALQFEEMILLLDMLDASTLGDILADIEAYRKTKV